MGPIPSVSIQKSIRYSQNWLRNKNISQISTQFTLWFIPRTVLLKMSPYYTSVPFWYSSSHSATRSRNHTRCSHTSCYLLSQTTHSHVIYWACAVPVAGEFPQSRQIRYKAACTWYSKIDPGIRDIDIFGIISPNTTDNLQYILVCRPLPVFNAEKREGLVHVCMWFTSQRHHN